MGGGVADVKVDLHPVNAMLVGGSLTLDETRVESALKPLVSAEHH